MNEASPAESRKATRLLVFGGIALVIGGMLLGEVYAIFVSHVANGEVRRNWAAAMQGIAKHDTRGVAANWARIEELHALRGRVMDTHSHITAYGMLALTLALLVPAVGYSSKTKTTLATLVFAGGTAHGIFVFLRTYTGSASSWLADAGGVLLLAGCAGFLVGLLRRSTGKGLDVRSLSGSGSARVFARGGALLILLGMAFGFYYAWVFVTRHEPGQNMLLAMSLEQAAAGKAEQAQASILAYRGLQSKIAITAAAHSHVIEYGMLAILLAFLQPRVFLSERAKRRWAWVFVLAALAMGLCIFGATIFGLASAGLADACGVFLLAALFANLVGAVRRTGAEDAGGAGAGT